MKRSNKDDIDVQANVGADSLRAERSLTWSVLGRSMVLPLLAFTITIAVFLPFARLGIDPYHDGVMLKPALDVFSGQRLFGDTWSHYGALATYIQVFFLWAMGKSLLAVKVGTVLAYGLTASILVIGVAEISALEPRGSVARRCVYFLRTFLIILDKQIMLPWSSVYAMVFQALGLLYLLRTIDGSSIYRPIRMRGERGARYLVSDAGRRFPHGRVCCLSGSDALLEF